MCFETKNSRGAAVVAVIVAMLVGTAAAQPAQDRTPPPVSSAQVTANIYVLTGGGGANASLLIGPEAALLVDSKGAGATEQIVAIAKELGSAPIRYLINGHEHPDHTGGNANFGRLGVTIMAHAGVRSVLAAGQRGGPPEPAEALPTVTFPDEGGLTLHVNGERVDILHAPPAHARSNSIVHYVDSNVLHLGDLYSPSRYQLIAGGTFQGFIDAADIALKIADGNTKIIPGVGAVTGREQLAAYRNMLVTVRDRIARLAAEGKTLEEVVAARPTMEFDATWGSPDSPLFLPVIYAEVSRRE